MSIWLATYLFGALVTGGSVAYICNDQLPSEPGVCAVASVGSGIIWPVTVGSYIYVLTK